MRGDIGKGVVSIPIDGEKTIYFDTDVEDQYFDRTEDPGELKIALLEYKSNETQGGDAPGQIDQIEDFFDIQKSSPQEGTIKIHLTPQKETYVGDAVRIKANLSDPSGEFEPEIFWIKISDPEVPKQTSKKTEKVETPNLGLPEFVLVYEKERDNAITWGHFENNTAQTMEHTTIMYPMVRGDKLEKIYINMDSTALKNLRSRSKNPNEEQLTRANKKYIASVYFHTLFLYTITLNRKYKLMQEVENSEDINVDLNDYLKDLFSSHYAEFILNFRPDEIMPLLEE